MAAEIKLALLIGINYRGTENALQGCLNDVHRMRDYLLQHRHYQPEYITLLTDDTRPKPTGKEILHALSVLVLDAHRLKATEVWLHYSGHGTQVLDVTRDELDGWDEALVPLDFETRGEICDDVISSYVQRLPETCRMVCFMDCCHSGTMLDLHYMYRMADKTSTVAVQKRTFSSDAAPHDDTSASDVLDLESALILGGSLTLVKPCEAAASTSPHRPPRRERVEGSSHINRRPHPLQVMYVMAGGAGVGHLHPPLEPPAPGLSAPEAAAASAASAVPSDSGSSSHSVDVPDIKMISGCSDHQTSADAYIGSTYSGAMTAAFLQAMEDMNYPAHVGCDLLLQRMRDYMVRNQYDQTPQLTTSRPLRAGSVLF